VKRQFFKVWDVWISALVLAGSALGQQAPPSSLQIVVDCYDYTHVPKPVMEGGVSAVHRIFAQAGINVLWRHLRLDLPDKPSVSRGEDSAPRLFIRILPRAMSDRLEQRSEAIGAAYATDDNEGFIASVFFDRLESLRGDLNCSRATILGHVIAHELGHLLLGLNSHSESGIMSANCRINDQIVRMRAGSLYFSADEAARIRRNTLERTR
jgi:hypothetical protein